MPNRKIETETVTPAMFRFKSEYLKLDIEGNVFEIKTTPELYTNIFAFQTRAAQLIKNTEAATEGKLIELCEGIIEKTLGAGAFKKIFANREPNTNDCTQVTLFIINKITEYNKA